MKKIIYCFITLIVSLGSSAINKDNQIMKPEEIVKGYYFYTKHSKHDHINRFINNQGRLIYEISKESQALPSIAIAQCALESGWGRSKKTPFGIKGVGEAGFYTLYDTTFINGVAEKRLFKFRKYHSFEAAIIDYIKLVTKNKEYLVSAKKKNISDCLDAISNYSETKEYALRIKKIIRWYKLDKLD